MSSADRSAPEPFTPETVPGTAARVGPNAVLQLFAPLRRAGGEQGLRSVFEAAGLGAYLTEPPGGMIPEDEVRRLFHALSQALGRERADRVLAEAGRGTADYVMRHRIPAPARSLLYLLPQGASARLLLRAIEKNAWTFAGSGRCRTRPGATAIIEIAANPIATPGCPWHRGVFAGMFRRLVHPATEVAHPLCVADGAGRCRFELGW